ncbi:MAG TPA: hypothetical protein DCM45_02915, partial [Clostridiales bacterium]|nr:hypothetical protein [Clostridiales bacterium]
ASVGVQVPTWTQYLAHIFIPQLIYVFLTVLVIDLFFKPDEEIQSKAFFKSELVSFGKMSKAEKMIAVISIILIALIATSSWHGISIGWLFVFAAVIMMLPGINLVKQEDVKQINYTFILFVVACLTIGIVSVSMGVGQFIANAFLNIINGSLIQTITGVWGLGFLINFALTPLAAYSAFSAPIVSIAQGFSINPLPVIYTFIHALEQVVFPYEYAPVLIIFGYGMISMGRFAKYNIIRAIISLACILAIFIPYWKLIGLV